MYKRKQTNENTHDSCDPKAYQCMIWTVNRREISLWYILLTHIALYLVSVHPHFYASNQHLMLCFRNWKETERLSAKGQTSKPMSVQQSFYSYVKSLSWLMSMKIHIPAMGTYWSFSKLCYYFGQICLPDPVIEHLYPNWWSGPHSVGYSKIVAHSWDLIIYQMVYQSRQAHILNMKYGVFDQIQ